jgi:hypothetical protein
MTRKGKQISSGHLIKNRAFHSLLRRQGQTWRCFLSSLPLCATPYLQHKTLV